MINLFDGSERGSVNLTRLSPKGLKNSISILIQSLIQYVLVIGAERGYSETAQQNCPYTQRLKPSHARSWAEECPMYIIAYRAPIIRWGKLRS